MIPDLPAAASTGTEDLPGPSAEQLRPLLEAWRAGDGGAPGAAWDLVKPAGEGAFRMEAGLLARTVRMLLGLDPDFGNAVLQHFDVPQVQGNLDLSGCADLVRFPAAVEVVLGRVDLSGCAALAGFGPKLMVVGDLRLGQCVSLTRLPAALKVLGKLDLSGCASLVELPRNLTVRGESRSPGPALDLAGCRSWNKAVPSKAGPFLTIRFPNGVQIQVWRLLLDRAVTSLWVLGGLMVVCIVGLCFAPWANVSGARIALRLAVVLGYAYVFVQAVRRRRPKR